MKKIIEELNTMDLNTLVRMFKSTSALALSDAEKLPDCPIFPPLNWYAGDIDHFEILYMIFMRISFLFILNGNVCDQFKELKYTYLKTKTALNKKRDEQQVAA